MSGFFKFFNFLTTPSVIRAFPLPQTIHFLETVKNGNIDLVTTICEKFPSIVNHCEIENPHSLFPLSIAIKAKNRAMIDLLTRQGASLHAKKTLMILNGCGINATWLPIHQDQVLSHVKECSDPHIKNSLLTRFKFEQQAINFKTSIDCQAHDHNISLTHSLLNNKDIAEISQVLINNARYIHSDNTHRLSRYHLIEGIPYDHRTLADHFNILFNQLSESDQDMLRSIFEEKIQNNRSNLPTAKIKCLL